jgi:hypothetical protein
MNGFTERKAPRMDPKSNFVYPFIKFQGSLYQLWSWGVLSPRGAFERLVVLKPTLKTQTNQRRSLKSNRIL